MSNGNIVTMQTTTDTNDTPSPIPAGWPEEVVDGCVKLDPAALLRAKPRSFALRVRGCSMIGADIHDGDFVVGEFTPEARPGAIVVALIDGESTLKRLVIHNGRPHLVSENPNCPDFVPLSELVIQGVVHTVVKRVQ
ncbi:MAG TPA: S24 family peptidase [Phycisphaerae bacterium]|nr:S24 family peptidase [Phycisphaerae bacterium]